MKRDKRLVIVGKLLGFAKSLQSYDFLHNKLLLDLFKLYICLRNNFNDISNNLSLWIF